MTERDERAPHVQSVPLEAPAVVGISADGRISRWDSRAEQIYGMNARQMIGMPALYLAPRNDPGAREWFRRVASHFGEAMSNLPPMLNLPLSPPPIGVRAIGADAPPSAVLYTMAVRADHTSAPVSLEAGPLRPQRSTTCALIVVRQLGEHRPDAAAELRALRARAKSLQTAISASRTLAMVIDEDTLICHVANTTTLPSGWEPGHLLGRSPLDFIHSDDRVRAAAVLAKVMREPGAHPTVVVKALTRGGQPIWVEARLTNALADPDVHGIVGSFSDVTDQVRDDARPTRDVGDRLEQVRFHNRLQRGLRDMRPERDLRLAYQPIVDLATGRAIAVEALLRWHHPKLGTIPPDIFVPIAEATGAINDIGRWVLSQACFDAVHETSIAGLDRGKAGPPRDPSMSMSVNVSSRQLTRASFLDDVTYALARSGLPADRLVLEVTETAMLDDWSTAAAALTLLSRRGIRIAIDDFGTGYATLKHLKQLPADIIKIDRSFVAGLGIDDGDTAIVTSVIQLAHALGTDVIAEGIETVAQRDRLVALGCRHGQGWLFGRATELP